MLKNVLYKKIIYISLLLIVSLLSIFVLSPFLSSTKFHESTIKTLDDKKITVMEISAATVGVSTVLAAIPGDATTPLANQILGLSSYLLIIIGAIFLEKILLTLTGYITFTFLIPISCLLLGIFIFTKKEILKKLALKLAVFGIVIFIVVPISTKISNLIENTYKSSVDQTIEIAKNTDMTSEESTADSEKDSGIGGITSKIKDSLSSIGDNVSKTVEKAKKILSNFIDAIAILIITSCVIPIIVLLSFIWIVKIIFSVNISIPHSKVLTNPAKLSDNNKKE